MNAADIANAALLEVGEEPVCALALNGHPSVPLHAPPIADKAMLLATLAMFGPDEPVRCVVCIRTLFLPPCVTVRDALRGITCGRGTR